jgi:hypothetical protein
MGPPAYHMIISAARGPVSNQSSSCAGANSGRQHSPHDLIILCWARLFIEASMYTHQYLHGLYIASYIYNLIYILYYIYINIYIYCTYTISVYYVIICTIQTRSAIFVNLACIVTLSGSALCTIQLHRSTVRFKQRTAVPNCLPLKCEHPGKSRSTVSALLFNQAIDKPCCQTENCQRLKEHWNHQGFQR